MAVDLWLSLLCVVGSVGAGSLQGRCRVRVRRPDWCTGCWLPGDCRSVDAVTWVTCVGSTLIEGISGGDVAPCLVDRRPQNCGERRNTRREAGNGRSSAGRRTPRIVRAMASERSDSVGWPDLAGLPGVDHAVEDARSAVTALRGHPANRNRRSGTATAALVRSARASAALDGAPLELDADSDIVSDPVLAGALRAARELGSLAAVWPRSPMQVLARLHTLAAKDIAPIEELGRPQPGRPGLGTRLSGFSQMVIAAPWPAPVLIAVVHGELLALRPFGTADGVVARAAARLTMISSGLDPAGLGVPEVAHLRSAQKYNELSAAFAAGSPTGVAAWIVEVCRCLSKGAREGGSIADSAV